MAISFLLCLIAVISLYFPVWGPSISRLPESGLFLFFVSVYCAWFLSSSLVASAQPIPCVRSDRWYTQLVSSLSPSFHGSFSHDLGNTVENVTQSGLPALHTMFLTMLMFLLEPLLCWLGHVFWVIVMLEYPSTIHFQCTGWLQCPGGTWPRPSSLWCGAVVLSH